MGRVGLGGGGGGAEHMQCSSVFFFTLPSQSVCFHPPQSPVVAGVTGAQMEKQKVRRKKLLFPFCL